MDYFGKIEEHISMINREGCDIDPAELRAYLQAEYTSFYSATRELDLEKEFAGILQKIEPEN